MNANVNATVSTCTDLEHLWAEQHCLSFVPPHPSQVGGMARFDSGVGMVSHTTITSYLHLANSTVGDYPSFNEVLSPTSPIKWRLMISQIYTMLNGVILPGEQRFNEEH